jgi:hypothetical protein
LAVNEIVGNHGHCSGGRCNDMFLSKTNSMKITDIRADGGFPASGVNA